MSRKKILILGLLLVLITSLQAFNVYIVLALSVATYLFIPLRFGWDKIALCLFLFSLLYSANIYFSGNVDSFTNLICYLISPIGFYRLGKYLTTYSYNYDDKMVSSILVFALIYSLPLYIMTIQGIASEGIVNISRQLDADAHNNLAATLYGLHASVGLGCVGIFFRYRSLRIWDKVCALCLVVGSLLTVIHLVNRTGLVVIVAVIVVLFIYKGKDKFFQTLLFASITLLILYYIFSSGILNVDIMDAYGARELSREGDSSSLGGRLDRWSEAVSRLFVDAWGWEGRHAHNLWLDIARVSGVFALIPFVIATILCWGKCIKLFVRKSTSGIIPLLLGLHVAMLLASFVEPVIEGSLIFFLLYILVWGVTVGYYNKK